MCVFHPSCGWVDISSGENIILGEIYQYSELLFKRLVDWSAAEEVLKTMEDYAKIYRDGLHWGKVEYNIGKQEFSLPNNYVPVAKSRLKSLELENQ